MSHLLLALLLQVHLHLQRLASLQEGLAVLAVSHVIGHDAHDDGTQVQKYVGQDLCGGAEDMDERNGGEAAANQDPTPLPSIQGGPL